MKKLFSLILSFSLLISVFSNSFITKAEGTEFQEGYYTYTVFNDEATITHCDTSISGDITIPSNFGKYTVTGISRDAFYGCNNIKSIKILYYIKGIADGAFEYCDSLTDISVSPHNSNYSSEDGILLNKSGTKILCCPKSKSGIVNIPYRVSYLRNEFNNRQNITQINISAKCTDIDARSFEGCSSLVSITVNKNNTSLSSKDGVLFNKDGTSLIACLNSKSGTYYVPDGVEEIVSNAFYGCEKITSVIIPDTVKSISSFSFNNCNNLTTISVSPNNNMFSSINGILLNKNKTEVLLCPKGKKGILDVPDGVTNIEEYAFRGCNGITQITVPSSIKNIDIDLFRCPFRDCENLTDISVSSNNQNYTSINGALFNKDKTKLLLCPQGKAGVYSVPNGVKEIEDDAFEDCKITGIKIPDSITSIGNFYNTNLINVTVSSNNMCYSSINGVLFNKDKTKLLLCPQGKAGVYSVPNGVKEIEDYAFDCCDKITDIEIPDSIINIGKINACDNLVNISVASGNMCYISINGALFNKDKTKLLFCPSGKSGVFLIPDEVKEINDDIFSYCYNLFEINVSIDNMYYSSINGVLFNKDKTKLLFCPKGRTEAYSVPDGVEEIKDYAFYNCKINHIEIPNSVSKIGSYAFYNCKNLTSMALPDSLSNIGEWAFAYCYNLTNINIPGSVTYICARAFSNCKSLMHVTISNGVRDIEESAFEYCRILNEIILPESLQTIGEFAFYACEHLSLDEIPKKVNKIGQQAFSGCKNLKQIILPKSITYFGYGVFSACENLEICCYRNSQAQKYAESNNIPFVLIKDSVNAPDAPRLKDKSYNYIRIVATVGYEYRMDNGEWQDSNVFAGLMPNEKHTFYQRIKETDTTYASKASLGTEITTDKMSVNAPSAPTVATKTHNSVTLNRVSGCEYSMDGINWQSSNVFENLYPDTEYTFYQRVAETDTTYASESSAGLKEKTDKDYISGDLDGVEGITDADAEYLLMYTFFPEDYPVNQKCDFNGDGLVNDADAEHLLMYTFFPEDYPLN